jgi:CMP-N-acetylneuraminic acid synthetase
MTNLKIIAMIPARMGSQRLTQKNLREIDGISLINRAIRKCKEVGVFDEIYVNSEHPDFGKIAKQEGVLFHQRPEELGSHIATSEQYIYEFLTYHDCEFLIQVHSIAPLLMAEEVKEFTKFFIYSDYDVLLSVVNEQIECSYKGKPVNFTYEEKINSQDLEPVQRITWSITGWKRKVYLDAHNSGKCATYFGRVGYYPVSRMAGLIIKTEADLKMAEALHRQFHEPAPLSIHAR